MLPWPENLIVLSLFVAVLSGTFALLAFVAEQIDRYQKHQSLRLRIQAIRKARK